MLNMIITSIESSSEHLYLMFYSVSYNFHFTNRLTLSLQTIEISSSTELALQYRCTNVAHILFLAQAQNVLIFV